MLGDTAARRRLRRMLGPWVIAGLAVWLALDNAPALIDEWRLRGAGDTVTGTVLSTTGGRPQRGIRRLWDDLLWGRGRRVNYRFAVGDGNYPDEVAFLTHGAADAVQQGGAIRVRYLAADPTIHRTDGEPGILLLSFRLIVALALLLLCVLLLRGARSRSERPPGSPSTRT